MKHEKSRKKRQLRVKTQKGPSKISYRERKPSAAICGECGTKLKGVPRERPYKMSNMPKTKKRPERPYGGVLCSKCTRRKIIAKIRS